jgi:hypothetical protein
MSKEIYHDSIQDGVIPPKAKLEEFDEDAYLQKMQDQYLMADGAPHWKKL